MSDEVRRLVQDPGSHVAGTWLRDGEGTFDAIDPSTAAKVPSPSLSQVPATCEPGSWTSRRTPSDIRVPCATIVRPLRLW